MPVISENVHSRSPDFANQRKAVILHDQGYSCRAIASSVVNYQAESPVPNTVRSTITAFSREAGRRRFHYHRRGRQPWKLTLDAQKLLILPRRLWMARSQKRKYGAQEKRNGMDFP